MGQSHPKQVKGVIMSSASAPTSPRAGAGSVSVFDSVVSVAVAVKCGLNSLRAFEWALDNLVSPGQTITFVHVRHPIRSVPTPMGNYIPITQVSKEAAVAYREQVNGQTEEMLMPYLELCERKQVQVEIRVLEDFNVPEAIVKYISWSGVSKLVMGSPSRSTFPRRMRAPDIPATVARGAPKHCIMYVVSKGKIAYVKSPGSSASTRAFSKIFSFDLDISTSRSPSNKSQRRDDRESSIFQSPLRTLSLKNPAMSRNILNPENETLHADKLIRSQSFQIGVHQSSTFGGIHSPTSHTEPKLIRSSSEFRRNLGIINEGSQSVSMLNVDAEIYSNNKTRSQASGEIAKLPSITNVSNRDNKPFTLRYFLSKKKNVMHNDQSSSDSQHDEQNSMLKSFGTKVEENTISMKNQFAEEPSEIEYTKTSSSPKFSEGDERHSLVILNSEGRGYSEENMELKTSPAGHLEPPFMAESSLILDLIGRGSSEENMELQISPTGHIGWKSTIESSLITNSEERGYSDEEDMVLQTSPTKHVRNETFFDISFSELEARRPQTNIVSNSSDRTTLNIEENALKFSEDIDEGSASGKTGLASSSSEMSSKRGQTYSPFRQVSSELLDLLSSEDDHSLDLMHYPHTGMDSQGCSNILINEAKTPDVRDVGTYVVEVPLQQDHDMTEDDDQSQVQITNRTHQLNHRFRQQVTNQICALISHHRVVPARAKEIMKDPEFAPIWENIPHDMKLLMRHIVGALNKLERLRDHYHSSSSSNSSIKDGDPPSPTTPPPPSSPPWADQSASRPCVGGPPSPSLSLH